MLRSMDRKAYPQSLHIAWWLRRQAIVEGVSIVAGVESLPNPAQEVARREVLERPTSRAEGDMALPRQGQAPVPRR